MVKQYFQEKLTRELCTPAELPVDYLASAEGLPDDSILPKFFTEEYSRPFFSIPLTKRTTAVPKRQQEVLQNTWLTDTQLYTSRSSLKRCLPLQFYHFLLEGDFELYDPKSAQAESSDDVEAVPSDSQRSVEDEYAHISASADSPIPTSEPPGFGSGASSPNRQIVHSSNNQRGSSILSSTPLFIGLPPDSSAAEPGSRSVAQALGNYSPHPSVGPSAAFRGTVSPSFAFGETPDEIAFAECNARPAETAASAGFSGPREQKESPLPSPIPSRQPKRGKSVESQGEGPGLRLPSSSYSLLVPATLPNNNVARGPDQPSSIEQFQPQGSQLSRISDTAIDLTGSPPHRWPGGAGSSRSQPHSSVLVSGSSPIKRPHSQSRPPGGTPIQRRRLDLVVDTPLQSLPDPFVSHRRRRRSMSVDSVSDPEPDSGVSAKTKTTTNRAPTPAKPIFPGPFSFRDLPAAVQAGEPSYYPIDLTQHPSRLLNSEQDQHQQQRQPVQQPRQQQQQKQAEQQSQPGGPVLDPRKTIRSLVRTSKRQFLERARSGGSFEHQHQPDEHQPSRAVRPSPPTDLLLTLAPPTQVEPPSGSAVELYRTFQARYPDYPKPFRSFRALCRKLAAAIEARPAGAAKSFVIAEQVMDKYILSHVPYERECQLRMQRGQPAQSFEDYLLAYPLEQAADGGSGVLTYGALSLFLPKPS